MLGPIGSNIMSIFRLLSPEEIDRYIETKTAKKVVGTMVAGGENFDLENSNNPDFAKKQEEFPADGQAEIIPINKFRKEKDKKQQEVQEENPEIESSSAKEKTVLESIGVLSSSSLREIERKRLARELRNQDSTTAFLIKERIKMRESKKRLVEQHALKSYQLNAAHEFVDNDNVEDEDEEQNYGTKGILINKKQF